MSVHETGKDLDNARVCREGLPVVPIRYQKTEGAVKVEKEHTKFSLSADADPVLGERCGHAVDEGGLDEGAEVGRGGDGGGGD
mgnify:CR=1 FL=1